MVLDEPPAPAARVELGFATCELAARRLFGGHGMDGQRTFMDSGTDFVHAHRTFAPGGTPLARPTGEVGREESDCNVQTFFSLTVLETKENVLTMVV